MIRVTAIYLTSPLQLRLERPSALPYYGRRLIEAEMPFKAVLDDGTWQVRGTLPKGWNGGTCEVKVRKKDGEILLLTHGQ